jgi:hypothetical protein
LRFLRIDTTARTMVGHETAESWLLRLAGLFGKKKSERELAEEMESHLQLHTEDNLRAGMNPLDARRNALIKLGGLRLRKSSIER